MTTRAQKRLHEYLINEEGDFVQENFETVNSEETQPNKQQKLSVPKLLDGTFFKISKEEDTKIEAVCITCGKTRKGTLKSTGNFMEHIKKDHPSLIEKVQSYRKQGCSSNVVKQQNTVRDMFKNVTPQEVNIRKEIISDHMQFHLN